MCVPTSPRKRHSANYRLNETDTAIVVDTQNRIAYLPQLVDETRYLHITETLKLRVRFEIADRIMEYSYSEWRQIAGEKLPITLDARDKNGRRL